jgi:hypothetical protein
MNQFMGAKIARVVYKGWNGGSGLMSAGHSGKRSANPVRHSGKRNVNLVRHVIRSAPTIHDGHCPLNRLRRPLHLLSMF